MKISTTIIGVCLLGLAIGAWAIQSANSRDPKVVLLPAPGDSPVTVRGGSVVAHGKKNSWKAYGTTGDVWTIDTGNPVANIFLRDVDPAMGTALTDVPLNALTTNWEVVLNFRDQGGKEDDTKHFLICSAMTSTASTTCLTSGSLTSTAVYLVSDESGTFSSDALDTQYRLRYDIDGCHGSNDQHPKCNHIFAVTTVGVSSPQKYKCVDGNCLIAISDKPF